jgi:hypothetical protein
MHYWRRASTVYGSESVACRVLHLGNRVPAGAVSGRIRQPARSPIELDATLITVYEEDPLSRRITMRASLAALVALAALALAVAVPARASAPVGFSFHASNITGISTGSAFLTGGGTFDPAGASVHAGGGFRCTNTIAQAPFAGCQAGQRPLGHL